MHDDLTEIGSNHCPKPKPTCLEAVALVRIQVPNEEIIAMLLLEASGHQRQDYNGYAGQADVDGCGCSCVSEMRIVLVEWRIIRGQENHFLDYWSRRETIDDRSGLIGEFLSCVEDPERFPWMTCELSPDWTCFVNVGLWRDADAFQAQIGWRLDDKRPKMPFEYDRRRRTFLGPQRWRFGDTAIPIAEHALVD